MTTDETDRVLELLRERFLRGDITTAELEREISRVLTHGPRNAATWHLIVSTTKPQDTEEH